MLELLNNGLLMLVLLTAALICSAIVSLSNPRVSKPLWCIRWIILVLLYPQKYVQQDYADAIPFELPNNSPILVVTGICFSLFYDLITGTKKGRQVRRKFRILPKLIPIDDYEVVEIEEPENLDGSNRQLKGEIIKNEHEVLKELVGEKTPEELSGFNDDDAKNLVDVKETMTLANQNFPDIEGKVENIAENMEYCESCNNPVKNEWKACPFCGEFLEVYSGEED